MHAKPSPGDRLHALGITAALFLLYFLGACRTVYVGDSGELVTAVAILGIPHPSGYPLYVLLGHLWSLLVPVGSVAFRMSLFSAFTGAAACGLLFLVARRLKLGLTSAYLAAFTLALAPSFWSQANIQRVYTLNALFVIAALYFAVRWYQERSLAPLVWAFFLSGIGACNHTFMVLFGATLSLWVVLVEPGLFTRPIELLKLAARLGGAFVLGLLPYAYLPIRSRMNPRLDWGNPETFDQFLEVIGRRDFWERAWIESAADLIPITTDYLTGLGQETFWVGAALAVAGILFARGRHWPTGLILLVMAVNLTSMALHGSRSDIFLWHRYYIPSFIMLALAAGMGWQLVAERLPTRASVVVLGLPLLMGMSGYAEFDRSRFRIAEDFANAVLEATPPGAHLSATDDNVLFVLIYLHIAEGRRPDLDLILQGVGDANLPELRFDPISDPLFFTHHPNWDYPTLEIFPSGVVYQAWRRGDPYPDLVLPRRLPDGTFALDGERDPRVPKDYLTQNLIGHFHYTLGFAFEREQWALAAREFRAAAEIASGNDVLFYNLGLVYQRNGLIEEAVAAFARSTEINPRHIASRSKPRASEKLAAAKAELARLSAIEQRVISQLAQRPSPGTPEFHLAMADLLHTEGETQAARGHYLRSLELAPPH